MTAIRALGLWPDKSEAHLAEAEAALESARQMNNEILQIWALVDLSEDALSRPDPIAFARAEAWAREAFAIALRMGDLRSESAVSLCNAAGASLLAGGDAQQAAAELRRALEMGDKPSATRYRRSSCCCAWPPPRRLRATRRCLQSSTPLG